LFCAWLYSLQNEACGFFRLHHFSSSSYSINLLGELEVFLLPERFFLRRRSAHKALTRFRPVYDPRPFRSSTWSFVSLVVNPLHKSFFSPIRTVFPCRTLQDFSLRIPVLLLPTAPFAVFSPVLTFQPRSTRFSPLRQDSPFPTASDAALYSGGDSVNPKTFFSFPRPTLPFINNSN